MVAQPSKRHGELVPKARPRPRSSLSPLVGREEAVERVLRETGAGARLVTITGPPGMGKTRLALACLERASADFAREGGAWFCDLSQARTEEDLLFTVLSSLRERWLGEQLSGRDAEAHLVESLASAGRMLLVLDNFEQIVFAAGVVARLCEGAPELHVVVTSRERLAVAGEVVLELAPLGCPREGDGLATIEGCEAVRLFVKRAREAGAPGEPELGAVAKIVRRLDGIPLAIELAASRTRLLPVAELAERLESGTSVLGNASRRDEGRHATLASAIEWSWGLLPEAEQEALARCSVFAGGFSMDMAESVVGEGAMDRLAALRDKSLVHTTDEGRLALYVSIRDFAAAKLEARDPGRARLLHARAFGSLARRLNAWRNLQGGAPDSAISGVARREKENFVAALAHVRTLEGEEARSLRVDLAVAVALLNALPGEACVDELGSALELLDAADHERRALLLMTRQSVYGALGRYRESLADLAVLRAMPDAPRGYALLALVYEGIQLRHQGYPDEAWIKHAQAARELETGEHARLRAMNEACMGRLRFDLDDVDASRTYNRGALALSESIGDAWLGALALANLAQLEQQLQDFEQARELLDEALARLRVVGEAYEAIYSSACGDLFFEWGKHDVARRWYDEGARFFRANLAHRHAALAYASAAALEAHDGDLVRARSLIAIARRAASRAANRVADAGVELHGASVEVAAASERERPAVVAAWRARLEQWARPEDVRGEVIRKSFDARFARRMAVRMLDRFAAPERPGPERTLRVARDFRWFAVGGGPRVDLARRGALRRILSALCEQHARGGKGIKPMELAALGWPGERVLVEAASTRVRVAVATLRRAGLRSMLITRDDGYVLEAGAVEFHDHKETPT